MVSLRNALTFVRLSNDGSRNDAEALINAFIVAGFNFFSSMAGIVTYQGLVRGDVDLIAAALVSLIYAGLGFFARLLAERGIKVQRK